MIDWMGPGMLAASEGGPPEVLLQLLVISTVGVAMALILGRLKLPVVTGLLLGGALVGPYGFGLLQEESKDSIDQLAHVGVILLLFSIGLEFSLAKLTKAWKLVLLGGAMQVGLTGLIVAIALIFMGERPELAVVLSFVVALSSTAIVLRGLSERNELSAPHGRFIVGVMIFQDLCVVPILITVPLLAPGANVSVLEILKIIGVAVAVVVGVILIARVGLPRLLSRVDKSRSRELFLMTILVICIGAAYTTFAAGLSMELGAFLAGMVLAETDFGERAMGDISPIRDALVSVFFITLGMLFDVNVLIEHPLEVIGIFLLFLFFKGLIATIAALVMRFPARVAWLAGVGLAQFGEFGFVIAITAERAGVATDAELAPWLVGGMLSMFITPLLIKLAPHVRAGELVMRPLERLLGVRGADEADQPLDPESKKDTRTIRRNHVVVVGHGTAGRLLTRALAEAGMPYIVLELNIESVKRARATGEPIFYGDITSPEAMHHIGIEHARALVLLINDPGAASRALDAAHKAYPQIPILLRCRYLAERDALLRRGASDVIVEEVEGGTEMLARVLHRLGQKEELIARILRAARDQTETHSHEVGISGSSQAPTFRAADLADTKAEGIGIQAGTVAVGRTLAELSLPSRTGALVLAIRHGETLVSRPDPHTPLTIGDVLVVVGTDESNRDARELLQSEGELPVLETSAPLPEGGYQESTEPAP